uniref:Uncharacterized protein n=1 Tax=Timema shepardi TaxID=629360 RepID=A0A7R9AMR8_TIMSH|nr:unnamed protein product [Timema shepardi]
MSLSPMDLITSIVGVRLVLAVARSYGIPNYSRFAKGVVVIARCPGAAVGAASGGQTLCERARNGPTTMASTTRTTFTIRRRGSPGSSVELLAGGQGSMLVCCTEADLLEVFGLDSLREGRVVFRDFRSTFLLVQPIF